MASSTTESDVQSALLRLSIMLATSIETLKAPAAMTHAERPPRLMDPHQIHKDLVSLVTMVRKNCTQYALAVRPEKSMASPVPANKSKPSGALAGLSASSLAAAKAQLDEITNDHLPKIVFIVRKAQSESLIYQAKSQPSTSNVENDEIAEMARKLGGVVMTAEQLGLRASGSADGNGDASEPRERPIAGHGSGWTRRISSSAQNLFEALAELCATSMDERTMQVLKRAAKARAAQSGLPQAPDNTATPSEALTLEQMREQVMQATSKVWSTCDATMEGLPRDPREHLLNTYQLQLELGRDAAEELENALQKEGSEAAADADEPDEDDFDQLLSGAPMTAEMRARAKAVKEILDKGLKLQEELDAILRRPEFAADLAKMNLDFFAEAIVDHTSHADDIVDGLMRGDDALEDWGSDEQEDEEDEAESHSVAGAVKDFVVNLARTVTAATGHQYPHLEDEGLGAPEALWPGQETSEPFKQAVSGLIGQMDALDAIFSKLTKDGTLGALYG